MEGKDVSGKSIQLKALAMIEELEQKDGEKGAVAGQRETRIARTHPYLQIFIRHRVKLPELARLCKPKLLTLKILYPSKFSAAFSSLHHFGLPCVSVPCREEFASYGVRSLFGLPTPEISSFLHKGFSEITCETIGKALHAAFVKGSVPVSIFHTNTLVSMYSRFGKVMDARYLFDQMPERNSASWNTMISAFVQAGLFRDAIWLFCEMHDRGIEPNGYVVSSFLTACSRSDDRVYEGGVQVHGLVLKIGLLYDVFVSTALLHFYGVHGFPSAAMKLFMEMPVRNVVSWTSLMVGYLDNGEPVEVARLYLKMRRESVSGNQNTFSTVISSCSYMEDEFLGHQLLGHVIKFGLETEVSVANSLISMFGSFSMVVQASYVFDCMYDRDSISWNSMIAVYTHNWMCEQSLRCFSLMRHVHNEANSITLSTLLSVCSSMDNLKWGRGIHGLGVKVGLDSNVCICNTLLTMYSEAGKFKEAEDLFQAMQGRDLISWNSMLAAYVQEGRCLDALKLLVQLLKMGKTTNYVTFASALAACSDPEFLVEGKIVHALAVVSGLHEKLIVGNALVSMYAKCGIIWEAKQVFKTMPRLDLVTWNALIGCFAENEDPEEAIKTFNLMRGEGEAVNYITMVNVLGACLATSSLLTHGMPMHAHIVLTGFGADEYVKNSLITMYAKCGDLNSSNCLFNGLVNDNSVTWNAMLAANAHHGRGEEALKLFVEMQWTGLTLDQFSFSAALAASANLAVLEEGQQLHGLTVKLGFDSFLYVTNCMMDMYGKCGEMNYVLKMLPLPNQRSRLTWNILISAFARHGSFQKAIGTFHEMLNCGAKPDHVTFVSLLSACSHGGLVDEGLAYFASMSSEFGVLAGIEHCVCVVDLLGRSGRFSEAEAFIQQMPVPPNDFVWRSLLAACRIHGNLKMGKKAAEHLLESDPSDDSAYVLYSNVCATSGRWEDVQNVRRKMESSSIKKQPACSWVKLKNNVTSFGIGDQSHPQSRQIYLKLGELKKEIKEIGYVPCTSFALHDTDEEQKEHNLWNHSEKLALAYGLINTTRDSTLRIFKNLRVCGDCHSVFKFVSSIIKKEIILRDPFRFHHFSGGKCSCGDYW